MGRTSRTIRSGVVEKLVSAGSTGAGTITIPNYGPSRITPTAASTTAEVWVLDAPAEGVRKQIMVTGLTTASTSTIAVTVRGSTGTTVKFGSSATQMTVTVTSGAVAAIAGVDLVGINSTLWGVVGNTTGIAFGTS
jgi:hypothetical protein